MRNGTLGGLLLLTLFSTGCARLQCRLAERPLLRRVFGTHVTVSSDVVGCSSGACLTGEVMPLSVGGVDDSGACLDGGFEGTVQEGVISGGSIHDGTIYDESMYGTPEVGYSGAPAYDSGALYNTGPEYSTAYQSYPEAVNSGVTVAGLPAAASPTPAAQGTPERVPAVPVGNPPAQKP